MYTKHFRMKERYLYKHITKSQQRYEANTHIILNDVAIFWAALHTPSTTVWVMVYKTIDCIQLLHVVECIIITSSVQGQMSRITQPLLPYHDGRGPSNFILVFST